MPGLEGISSHGFMRCMGIDWDEADEASNFISFLGEGPVKGGALRLMAERASVTIVIKACYRAQKFLAGDRHAVRKDSHAAWQLEVCTVLAPIPFSISRRIYPFIDPNSFIMTYHPHGSRLPSASLGWRTRQQCSCGP